MVERNEMAQSFEPLPAEGGNEPDDSVTLDNTCPECNAESIVTYMDRHSSYEYCTNCDWSDEEDPGGTSPQQIRRSSRDQDEG